MRADLRHPSDQPFGRTTRPRWHDQSRFAGIMARNFLKWICAALVTASTVDAGMAAMPAPISRLPATPERFIESVPAQASPAQAVAAWWTVFNDPVLDDLVARANRNNTSIEQAAAHLAQVSAKLRGAAATRLPTLDVSASASHQTGPLINAAGGNGTLFNIGGSLSYEVDLLGRLSKSTHAARLDVQSHEALLRSAVLMAQSETVQTYFEIRALDAELAVLAEIRETGLRTNAIVEGRFARGLASELDVQRARGEQGSIDSDLAGLEQRRAQAVHSLAFVMGESPARLDFPQAQPGAPPAIPADIPSTMLARRPDVAAAERALRATQLRLKIAQTSWLPRILMTANGGVASSALGDLLKSSAQSIGVGLLLSLPVFDGGRRKAGIAGATADLELATVDYRAQILSAFRDVEDQLAAVRQSALVETSAKAGSAASERALAIVQSRQVNGLASDLELLDARRTALRCRRAEVHTHYARFIAAATLVRALGGGWSTQ